MLYDCSTLTDGCSSCTHLREFQGLECGWCISSNTNPTAGTCAYTGDCSQIIVGLLHNDDSLCPAPIIASFYPTTGPIEGGTTITITGMELGATFDDFMSNTSSISVGVTPCTPIPQEYIPGKQVKCILHKRLSDSARNNIVVSLHTGQGVSEGQFRILEPRITGVFPVLGPAAGGTNLTLFGVNLNIGNVESTRVLLQDALECYPQYVGLFCVFVHNLSCSFPDISVKPPLNFVYVKDKHE